MLFLKVKVSLLGEGGRGGGRGVGSNPFIYSIGICVWVKSIINRDFVKIQRDAAVLLVSFFF